MSLRPLLFLPVIIITSIFLFSCTKKYKRNKSHAQVPYSSSVNLGPGTEIGRWLTMDTGDINGDGRIDIVLGNFSIGPAIGKAYDWKKGPPFKVLKNMGVKEISPPG